MKILFVNLPYHGHVIPTVGLVRELVRRGHHVTYLLPAGWESSLAGSGADFLPYENTHKLDRQIRSAFRTAETVIAGYDLLLYEQFFFLGKHLAEKYGKKCVRVFTSPATTRDLMKQFLSSGGPMGIFRVPFVSTLWTRDAVKGLGIRMKCSDWLREVVENPPDCNLVYTLREFQPCAEQFPAETFHFIGPSVYDRQEQFPRLSSPVIYISLGTIVKGADRFFRICLDAFRQEAVHVVLSTGEGNFPEKPEQFPENFLVRNRVPQTAVLKQASLFVTHGGLNSVSEAMAAGVPMIVIPFVSDQPVNGKQVARLGLGKVLHRKDLTAGILRDTAFSILADDTIRANMDAMQETVRQSPGNAGAAEIIEAFFTPEKRDKSEFL